MKKISLTVVIPTSGVSEGLGDLNKYTNKSLIKIGKKPALSYIIESYPKDTKFVITLGHFADQVRDYTSLVHPKSNIQFVDIDVFQGPGSSLGYSLLKAKKYLQKPFIYHASDTIVQKKVKMNSHNWVAGCKGSGSSQYHSFGVIGNTIQRLDDKGAANPDFIHIGLVGVRDFNVFWDTLEALYSRLSVVSDVTVINHMIKDGIIFKVVPVDSWFDVGNTEGVNAAREQIDDSFHILDKPQESIYIFDRFVVKFFFNEKMVKDRVKRVKYLAKLTPKLLGVKGNFYKYEYIKGDLFADVATPTIFPSFLKWATNHIWTPAKEVSDDEFKIRCLNFYKNKTAKRVDEFLTSRNITDTEMTINDLLVPAIDDLLKYVDFDYLSSSKQTHFHGDFILDNILKTNKAYVLLDWRQDFGGLIESGDMYYDLAKLNHNLTINHGIVNRGLYTLERTNGNIFCDILRKNDHVACQEELFRFVKENDFDLKKIKVLTALIWINMAPLHNHPLDNFLFYFGKYNLWRALNESN